MDQTKEQKKPEALLKKLKGLDLQDMSFTFWVIHRISKTSPFSYSAKRLNTSKTLQTKLTSRLSGKIGWANSAKEYAPEQRSLDEDEGTVLSCSPEETDFALIVKEMGEGVDAPLVKSQEELNGAFGYAVEFSGRKSDEGQEVIAFRKLTESWNVEKLGLLEHAFWKDHMLVDANEGKMFRIEAVFDFVAYESSIFILDRKRFENGLNFRKGLERKSEAVVQQFESLRLFVDIKPIKEKCLKNLRYLRRLSTIEKRGYYQQPDFLQKLQVAAKAEGWKDLEFDEAGLLKITDENLDAVLSVLADHRLKSPVTFVTYDADSAEALGKSEGAGKPPEAGKKTKRTRKSKQKAD